MDIESIAKALGNGKEIKVEGGWSTLCPAHEDKEPSLSLTEKDGELIIHCHVGCDWKIVKDAIRAKGLLPERDKKKDLATFIWDKSKSDPAIKKYLLSRNIELKNIPKYLRFNKYNGQMMIVAAVTNPNSKEVVAIHKTYLNSDYQKTDRKMLGKCSGRAVWLSDPAEKMLVGEGIETTLSAMEATGLPGAACLSTSGMKRVKIPKKVKEIVILVDSDPKGAGQAAAQHLANSFSGKTMFATPDDTCFTDNPKKLDFNDLDPDQIRERFESLIEPDQAPAAELIEDDDPSEKKSSTQRIIEIVLDNAILFRDPDDIPYAKYKADGHMEVWPLESKQFRQWVGRSLYVKFKMAPNKNAMNDALNVLAGQAIYDGAKKEVNVRVAVNGGIYFLDPCLDDWRVIKVEPGKWIIEENDHDGIAFRRTSTMRPLPVPENCNFDILPGLVEKHLNVGEEDARLLIAFLIECLRPDTEYPVVEVTGSPGSGKSTIQEMIRDCIDPNKVNLRAAPKTIDDIFVSAANNHLTSYNNLSRITAGQSDAFCTLSTGGGSASRTLFTNTDESSIDVKRPVILNGVGQLAKMPDLIDRLIKIRLKPIGEENNRSKKDVMDAFRNDRGKILGSLLDLFSKVLSVLPTIELNRLPRMADFAKICEAITLVYQWEKPLLQTYYGNRAISFEDSLETSPAMMAVVNIVNDEGSYKGTIGNLYEKISWEKKTDDPWVKTARGLGEKLRLHQPALKAIGIEIEFDTKRQNDGYHVFLSKRNISSGYQPSQRTQHSQKHSKSEHQLPLIGETSADEWEEI